MGSSIYHMVYNLLNTVEFVIAVKVLSVILFVVFCAYFFFKRGTG